MLKVIGCIAMLVDHIGIAYFSNDIWFRLVGRLAFPLFAYSVGQGIFLTSNIDKYIWRLYICAFISQIPYSLFFHTFHLNVVFTFLFSVVLAVEYTKMLRSSEYRLVLFVLLFVFFALMCEYFKVDYGVYGFLLTFSFFLFHDDDLVLIIVFYFLTVLYCTYVGNMVQMWCLLSAPIIYFYRGDDFCFGIPKRFFYYFYPVHLLILYLGGVL